MSEEAVSVRWVPRVAVLSPFTAAWLLRRLDGAAFRDGAAWAQSVGRPELARELRQALDQLKASAGDWETRRISASGRAEVEDPESGPSLDRPPPGSGMTTGEVATQLKISTRQVTNLIVDRKLVATKVGRAWQIDSESVDEYTKTRRSR